MLAQGGDRLDWGKTGDRWPNHQASRFRSVGHIRWHLQIMGDDHPDTVLLVHGTGASTHSFRDLMPILAVRFRVICCDLPGHGFTEASDRAALSLDGMANALVRLIGQLNIRGNLYGVGHSAGAAILLSIAARRLLHFDHIFGINAALEPMRGSTLLSPLAKAMFLNPLTPRILSWQARYGNAANNVLSATGSQIDDEMRRCYIDLFRNPAHIRGALGMMASWDLVPLRRAFPRIEVPVTLVAAEDDQMVPARISREASAALPNASYLGVPHGGHLLHEVYPETIAQAITEKASH
jgi:magnesium chelatase accessory protein